MYVVPETAPLGKSHGTNRMRQPRARMVTMKRRTLIGLCAVVLATMHLTQETTLWCDSCGSNRVERRGGIYVWTLCVASTELSLSDVPSPVLQEVLDPDRHVHKWTAMRRAWTGIVPISNVTGDFRDNEISAAMLSDERWRARVSKSLRAGDFSYPQLEAALAFDLAAGQRSRPIRSETDETYVAVVHALELRYGEPPSFRPWRLE